MRIHIRSAYLSLAEQRPLTHAPRRQNPVP
jgi:hypothetical protein